MKKENKAVICLDWKEIRSSAIDGLNMLLEAHGLKLVDDPGKDFTDEYWLSIERK